MADVVDGLKIPEDADPHRRIQSVCAVFQFGAHELPLPGIPVRDMGVPFARICAQHAGLVQDPGSSAGAAGKLRAFAFHLPFPAALRTLVQDAVQSVRAEGFIHPDLFLLLRSEVVESKSLF